jgi:hypothetical protein
MLFCPGQIHHRTDQQATELVVQFARQQGFLILGSALNVRDQCRRLKLANRVALAERFVVAWCWYSRD